jgi:Putative auto-transporter adhesin, head GIN domain
MSPSPRIAILLPAVAAAVALSGCVGIDAGPTTADKRDVAAFSRIKAEDQVDVNVRAGEPRRLTVRAGEKVIDDVRTEVRDGTLYISYDGPGIRKGRLLVEVAAPRVEAIGITGSADVFADALNEDALDIRVSGAGDITAEGRTDRLTVDVSGSGDADLADLRAGEARVDLSGAGDADVRAADRLDADVSGAGDLAYRGDPALTQHVTGSGDIEHAG